MITLETVTKKERELQIKSREDFKNFISKKEAERRAAAELFNIDEFIADVAMTREVYVEEIDRRVQFKKLTLAENSELVRIKNAEERGLKMLYLMLHKANSEVTEDSIQNIGSDVAAVVLTAVVGAKSFLGDLAKTP